MTLGPAADRRPNPPPAGSSSDSSSRPALKLQRPLAQKQSNAPASSSKIPIDYRQQTPPPSKYPVDSKQAAPQHSNPPIHHPRPHKKTGSTGSPDLYATSSNQYLRPTSPMPGAWPSRSPAPTPPPPGYSESGDHKQSNVATIAQGASTMVHGLFGLISNGKK